MTRRIASRTSTCIETEAKPYRPGDGFIARIDSPYLPLAQAVWVTRTRYGETDQDFIRGAWSADALAVYRWFADLPAFDGLNRDPACAFFVDLRFLIPGREGTPFRYGACRDGPGAAWRLLAPE